MLRQFFQIKNPNFSLVEQFSIWELMNVQLVFDCPHFLKFSIADSLFGLLAMPVQTSSNACSDFQQFEVPHTPLPVALRHLHNVHSNLHDRLQISHWAPAAPKYSTRHYMLDCKLHLTQTATLCKRLIDTSALDPFSEHVRPHCIQHVLRQTTLRGLLVKQMRTVTDKWTW